MNDFVLLKDRYGMLNPSPEDVRFLCDRRAGVGGDGLIRAVKAEGIPDWDGAKDIWYMDYRNSDGSPAETCGNGLRVFVRWLVDENLVSGTVIQVATRAGLRKAVVLRDGRISVTMGVPSWDSRVVGIDLCGKKWTGRKVDVGNPHLVVHVEDPTELDALDLCGPLVYDAEVFPEGTNVEFVTASTENKLKMRVYERGSGETMSCGTGVVAASTDARALSKRHHDTFQVDVPGGTLKVTFDDEGEASMTGPAVIVARGEVTLPDG
jgi:diaminopimelate epimerase